MYSGHRYVQLCVQASGQLIRQLKSHQIAQATTNGLKQKTTRKRTNLKTEVGIDNQMCQQHRKKL